jgi:hypothetical protein
VKPQAAEEAGRKFLEMWDKRAAGQDYPAWMAEMGEAAFIENLFGQGCTVIPTFEACNGYNVVDRNFNLEGFWPGRAVPGLHTVAEVRDDKAPLGTILEVRKPGYITATAIVPAEVAVSSGTGYVSPNLEDPLPLIPNLYLPHPRTLADWRATWLPTHPEHFETPALWGWDMISGRFLQLNGPIWDPLHYHYGCMEVIRQALKKPLPHEQNSHFVPVPDAMMTRFYPVTPMTGFDVIAFEAIERRRARGSLPQSAVTHVPDKDIAADIGYHPMPLEFEYELDPFWFPELHPVNREHGACPEPLKDRICPVIRPMVSPEKYADAITADDAYPWLADTSQMLTPGDKALDNYPMLARYLLPDTDPEALSDIMPLPFLGEVAERVIRSTPQTAWKGYDELDTLEGIADGLYDAAWSYREGCMETLRLRHMCYQTAPGIYRLAWWHGASLAELAGMYASWYVAEQQAEGGGNLAAASPEATGTAPARTPMAQPGPAVAEGEIK